MRIPEAALAADVARALDRRGISFMLVGAAALAVRGLSRGTHDIDFMTTSSDVLRLDWTAELGMHARVEARRGESDDPLAGVVRFSRDDASAVDLVVAKWVWQQEIIDRSEILDLDSLHVRVPAVEDLVLLKLEAGSYLDQRDAAQLLEIHGADASARVEAKVAKLPEPVRRAWRRLRDELESSE